MSDWGYTELNGPHTWAANYEQAAGSRQSPIDICFSRVTLDAKLSNTPLQWHYNDKTIDVTNTGYGWKAHVKGEGSCLHGGPLSDKYQLEQYHCHWGANNDVGSEHLVDGLSYAAELHLVHWNTKYGSFAEALKHGDGLAVLGVFFKVGQENSEISKITDVLSEIKYKNQTALLNNKSLNPATMLPKDHSYWTYLGSLTTPPCYECVIWIVFKEPIEVSSEQLQVFRSMCCADKGSCCSSDARILNNFRPPLPSGDRIVRASYV